MKIQLSYRFTGEDPDEVIEMLKKIKEILEKNHHDVYVPALNPKKSLKENELLKNTFQHIEECEAVIAIVKSSEKSEGQLLEIGYALGRKKQIYTLINKNIKKTRLREVANKIIEFSETEDMYQKLNEI